ncbi:site-specific integrase [Rhodococcus erythropolis]|uniref:tyrosine-type recombinase/integrase n=1 Tax=Rhodococcus erythropolis TaxID=1833 RepID=UPI0024B9FE38|nr:site-specific integrase [Rhodococcus erythropolis]MDJ0403912.1 site-specific integrase [Rhodococcus erythropolis]
MVRPPLPVGTWGTVKVDAYEEERDGKLVKKWRARARIRDADGRTRQIEKWSTKSEAAAKRALNDQLSRRSHSSGKDITTETPFTVCAGLWVDEIATSKLLKQTREKYEHSLQKTIVPALGGLRLGEITTGRADRFLKAVAERTPGNARMARVVLAAIMDYAVRHDALRTNPVDKVAALPASAKEVRALTLEELARLRAAIAAWQEGTVVGAERVSTNGGRQRTKDLLPMVDVWVATGIRPGELLALLWTDIDLESNPATLRVTGTNVHHDGKLIRQEKGKTRSARRILTLPVFAAKTLQTLKSTATTPYVFPSSTGTLRDPHNMGRQFREARGEEFAWVTPHVFRKTTATLIEQRADLEAAASQLGHSNSKVTERHYVVQTGIAPNLSELLEVLRPDA